MATPLDGAGHPGAAGRGHHAAAADGDGCHRRAAALARARPRAAALLLPAGLLGIVAGTVLFGLLSAKAVAGVVGAMTLLFLAQRLLFPPPRTRRPCRAGLGGFLRTCLGVHQLRRPCRRAADPGLRAADADDAACA
jgi:hypothetical protein